MGNRAVIWLPGAALALCACAAAPAVGVGGDSGGAGGDADVVPIHDGLRVAILHPNGSHAVLHDTRTDFVAEFRRGTTVVAPDVVSWSSSVKGFLGDTNPLSSIALGIGTHDITVTGALDGDTTSAEIEVVVGDIAIEITAPSAGVHQDVDSPLTFSGEASASGNGGTVIPLVAAATRPGERRASYAWRSDRDGMLSEATSFSRNGLSIGNHEISLTVHDDLVDGSGAIGVAVVAITILPLNEAPRVTVTSPPSCPVVIEHDQSLTLTGEVTDGDAADAGLVGDWSDQLTGQSQRGAAMTLAANSLVGKHTVVFLAIDHSGASGSATCDVFVKPDGADGTELFPDTAALNARLVGGSSDTYFVGTDDGDNLFVGTDHGLTSFAGDLNNAATTLDENALGLGSGQARVTDVLAAEPWAWVATDEGLAQCDYDAVTAVLAACSILSPGSFRRVHLLGEVDGNAVLVAGSDSGLWVGTVVAGVVTDAGTLTASTTNLPADAILDVLAVADDLYIAGDLGLCLADDPAAVLADPMGTPLCASTLTKDNSLLPTDALRALAFADDHLWIGTAAGLVRNTPATGALVVYDPNAELAAAAVDAIAIDGDGIIWALGDAGVTRLDPATGATVTLGATDFGLSPGGLHFRSLTIDGDDTKWVATDRGILAYAGH